MTENNVIPKVKMEIQNDFYENYIKYSNLNISEIV